MSGVLMDLLAKIAPRVGRALIAERLGGKLRTRQSRCPGKPFYLDASQTAPVCWLS